MDGIVGKTYQTSNSLPPCQEIDIYAIGFRGCKAWVQGESVLAMCMINQTWIIINMFPYTYRFCMMSVLKFGWRLMEQLRSESVSYQIVLFPPLLMTSSVFVGKNVLDTRHHVGPNFVVKWNKIKLESVSYGLVWLFVKFQQFCMLASPFLKYMSTWRHWRRIH